MYPEGPPENQDRLRLSTWSLTIDCKVVPLPPDKMINCGSVGEEKFQIRSNIEGEPSKAVV